MIEGPWPDEFPVDKTDGYLKHQMHPRSEFPFFGDYKIDKRPKKGWWAPGGYMNKCHICKSIFIGDKRAGHCSDCEYKEEE